MEDLLTFMKALEGGEWLSDDAYSQMKGFRHRYDKGIRYGMGMMYFNFRELSFCWALCRMYRGPSGRPEQLY